MNILVRTRVITRQSKHMISVAYMTLTKSSDLTEENKLSNDSGNKSFDLGGFHYTG